MTHKALAKKAASKSNFLDTFRSRKSIDKVKRQQKVDFESFRLLALQPESI
jgi:hypothetical protein